MATADRFFARFDKGVELGEHYRQAREEMKRYDYAQRQAQEVRDQNDANRNLQDTMNRLEDPEAWQPLDKDPALQGEVIANINRARATLKMQPITTLTDPRPMKFSAELNDLLLKTPDSYDQFKIGWNGLVQKYGDWVTRQAGMMNSQALLQHGQSAQMAAAPAVGADPNGPPGGAGTAYAPEKDKPAATDGKATEQQSYLPEEVQSILGPELSKVVLDTKGKVPQLTPDQMGTMLWAVRSTLNDQTSEKKMVEKGYYAIGPAMGVKTAESYIRMADKYHIIPSEMKVLYVDPLTGDFDAAAMARDNVSMNYEQKGAISQATIQQRQEAAQARADSARAALDWTKTKDGYTFAFNKEKFKKELAIKQQNSNTSRWNYELAAQRQQQLLPLQVDIAAATLKAKQELAKGGGKPNEKDLRSVITTDAMIGLGFDEDSIDPTRFVGARALYGALKRRYVDPANKTTDGGLKPGYIRTSNKIEITDTQAAAAIQAYNDGASVQEALAVADGKPWNPAQSALPSAPSQPAPAGAAKPSSGGSKPMAGYTDEKSAKAAIQTLVNSGEISAETINAKLKQGASFLWIANRLREAMKQKTGQ